MEEEKLQKAFQDVDGIKIDDKSSNGFGGSPIQEHIMTLENASPHHIGVDYVNDDIGEEDDLEPLILDIEEIECRMTDIDENESHDERENLRNSVIHTPKDFPTIIPSGKIKRQSRGNQNSNLTLNNLAQFDAFSHRSSQSP